MLSNRTDTVWSSCRPCCPTETEYNLELTAAAATFAEGEVKVFPKKTEGDDTKKEVDEDDVPGDTEKPAPHKQVSRCQVCVCDVTSPGGWRRLLWPHSGRHNLPLAVRATDSLSSIKKQLKTFLFKRAFSL